MTWSSQGLLSLWNCQAPLSLACGLHLPQLANSAMWGMEFWKCQCPWFEILHLNRIRAGSCPKLSWVEPHQCTCTISNSGCFQCLLYNKTNLAGEEDLEGGQPHKYLLSKHLCHSDKTSERNNLEGDGLGRPRGLGDFSVWSLALWILGPW